MSPLMKHASSPSSMTEQAEGASPRTSTSCTPRKRRRTAPTASTSSRKSSSSSRSSHDNYSSRGRGKANCNDDKLASSTPSSISAPPPPKTDIEPSDDCCSVVVAGESIFTRSFAPMLLYSSVQDNITSANITNRRCNSTAAAASCTLSVATAPTTQSLNKTSSSSSSSSTRAVNGTLQSPCSSSTTSQSSPSSTQTDEEEGDRNCAPPFYTATAEYSSLPPLPTTVSCPHPALYPPPPRLPPLLSPPKLLYSYLDQAAYCPSLFGQGLPQLPKETRPLLRLYSVDLHGSKRQAGKRNNIRKQTTQSTYGNHLPPSPNHHQHHFDASTTSLSRQTEHYQPARSTHSIVDSIPPLTMARAVHGRRRPQAQQGGAATPQRRFSSRSLGDLPLDTSEEMAGDVSLESQTDVLGGQDVLAIPPFQYAANSGRPIRSTRLRVSTASAELSFAALLTIILLYSPVPPVKWPSFETKHGDELHQHHQQSTDSSLPHHLSSRKLPPDQAWKAANRCRMRSMSSIQVSVLGVGVF